MHIKKLCLFFFIVNFCTPTNFKAAALQENKDVSQTYLPQNSFNDTEKKNAEILFAQILPTNSINEQIIEQIYGTTGLNLPTDLVTKIKKSYCYLEFLTKFEIFKKNQKSTTSPSAFQPFLEQQTKNIALIPTQELVNSKDWQSITITQQDLIASQAWQTCIKGMICDSFDTTFQNAADIMQAQNIMATYLQNIETAYPTDDYTKLRLYIESLEMQNLSQSIQRKHYGEQSNEWKNFNQQQLQQALKQFKTTPFYSYTHNSQQNKALKTAQENKQKTTIPSPTQEQIICFFIFNYIQDNLNGLLTTTNLETIITNQNQQKLLPNFFNFQPTDFVYLYDFLTLKDAIEYNRKNPCKTTITMQPTDENSAQQKKTMQNKKTEQIKSPNSQINAEQVQALLISKIFTQDFPTNSIYEKTIEKIYGPSGLHIAPELLQQIQQTYCYLEFLVKRDKVKNNPQYQHYLDDFKNFMELPPDQSPIVPTQTLVATSGWNAISVTDKEIQESPAWQSFLKLLICDSLTSSTQFIIDHAQVSRQMLAYLPDIEANYDDNDFIQMNLYTQSIQTAEILQLHQKKSYISQCLDWKNLSPEKLKTAVDAFKKSELYLSMHINQKNSKTNSQKSTISLATKEQVLSYFMLITLQEKMYDLMTAANLQNFLHQASTNTIAPNFFNYKDSDFIYLYDYLTTLDLINQNKLHPKESAFDSDDDDNNNDNDNVVIQSKKTNRATRKTFKKIGKNLNKALTESVKNLNDVLDKVIKFNINTSAIVLANITYGFVIIGGSEAQAQKEKDLVKHKLGTDNKILTMVVSAAIIISVGLVLFPLAPLMIGGFVMSSMFLDSQSLMVQSLMFIMSPFMQGMEILTDKMSNGFIGFAAGCTLAGCYIAVAFGGTNVNPKLEANKVRKKLEENKAALNIAMSIFITIAITVIMIAVPIIAPEAFAYFGGIMATETAATVGTTAATETAVGATAFAGARAGAMSGARAGAMSGARAGAMTTVAETGGATASTGARAGAISATRTSAMSSARVGTVTTAAETGGATEVAASNSARGATEYAIIAEDVNMAASTKGSQVGATQTVEQTSAQTATRTSSRILQQIADKTIYDTGFMIGQALNVGFGVFTVLGAQNQDLIAVLQAKQEEAAVKRLWKFVENNKLAALQEQTFFADELHKKHQAATENQAFGLLYYKNFLNGSVNLVQQQIAQVLAQQYLQLLTPDENNLTMADIGSTWGLQTKFVYLYPSQGFITTTLGRPDFPYAQEIAQAPLAVQQASQQNSPDLNDKPIQATNLWFNQRAVTSLNQPKTQPLDVEIRFRVIYNLTTAYHVGLYLGGNYHDYNSPEYLTSLQETGQIDLDTANLAKMFVIKRDNAKEPASIGLYENEGKNWIIDQPLADKAIDMSSIYHMSARLDKTQLTVAFWKEDTPSEKFTQTVTVTACDQRTFGIIFSGMAIEWGVVKPNLPIIENEAARKNTNGQTEIDREKDSKAQWKKILHPQLGIMKLQAINKIAILQGQYLYTTQDTNLIDLQGNPITDYVLCATNSAQSATDTANINNLAINPADINPDTNKPFANVIVSLISGNVYNSSRKIIAQQNNVLQTYLQKNPTISHGIIQAIQQASQNYQQQNLSAQNQETEQLEPTVVSQTVSLSDLAHSSAPVTGGNQIGLSNVAPAAITTATQSISSLQAQAAGSANIENIKQPTQIIEPAQQTNSAPVQPTQSFQPQSATITSDEFELAGAAGLSF